MGVIEQSISLVNDVKGAREASKHHLDDILKYLDDLNTTRSFLQLVKETDALKTNYVAECAARIKQRSNTLNDFLQKIIDKGGFWHKLKSGRSEDEELRKKMSDVQRAKQDLDSAILCVNVGLTGDIHNQAFADKKLIVETNTKVQKVMGEQSSLNIAKVVKDKIPNGNVPAFPVRSKANKKPDEGKVIMNQEDIDNLAQLAEARNGRKITIQNNTTRDRALQFNAPIGTDLWKDIDELDISFNTAENQSRQFNYAQTMDVYLDQMAKVPKPLDSSFLAVLVAVVALAALYIFGGK